MTRRVALAFAFVAAMLIGTAASDRAIAQSTAGTISGRVLSSDAPATPVRRARVVLQTAASTQGWSATTEDDGTFVVRGLPAGRYTVQVSKPAWLTMNYGAARPGRAGTPIALAEGAHVRDVTVRLSRGGVISGTVRDALGQPLPRMTVGAMRHTYAELTGEKTIARVPGAESVTDDEGRYRIFGLMPGDYVVVAANRGGPPASFLDLVRVSEDEVRRALAEVQAGAPVAPTRAQAAAADGAADAASRPVVSYAPTYHPASPDAGRAVTIRLEAGEERGGISIVVAPIQTTRITVVADVPPAANPASLQVFLVPHQTASVGGGGMQPGRRNADGHFEYPGLAPGSYTVVARAAAGGPPAAGRGQAPPGGGAPQGRGAVQPLTFYAAVDVEAAGPSIRVPVGLREGMTVSGRVVLEGSAGAPMDTTGMRIALLPLRSGPALGVGAAAVSSSGTFQFTGVPAGRYRLDYSWPGMERWMLRAATGGGGDLLDLALEITDGRDVNDIALTLSEQASEIAGRLQTPAGQPATDVYIIAFPVERAFWTPRSRRVAQARPATDGAFTIRGLPAGDYLIAAVIDVEPGQWYDPEFLAALVTSAARIAVRIGARTDVTLEIR